MGPIVDLCSTTNPEIVFQKYNADASVLEWTKCFAADGAIGFGYMFPTNDNGYVLGGSYGSSGGLYISKRDAMDNIVWSKSHSVGSGATLWDMKQTNDGGYIMVGQVFYVDTNFTVHHGSWSNADIGVLKLDSLGNKQWSKVLGGSGDDHVCSVVEGPDNSYFVSGTTPSNDFDFTGNHGGEGDTYVVRLDNNGNIIWHRDFGGTGTERTTHAVSDDNGGLIVTASTTSTDGDVTHPLESGQNIWAFAIDSNNNILWNSCYGGGGDCYPNAICKATDGSIWIAGVANTKIGEIEVLYGF